MIRFDILHTITVSDTTEYMKVGQLTLTQLIAALKNVFASKDDLSAMEARQDKKYATKNDLKDDLNSLEKRIDGKISASESRINGKISASESRINGNIVSFKDEILSEIKDLRDDVVITTGYRDMIEDHDVRIEALEKAASFSKTP